MDEQPNNPNNGDSERSRRGGARYRQQRRKDRRLKQTRTQARLKNEQVAPTKRPKLPQVPVPNGVLRVVLYGVIGIGLVLGMVFLLRLANPPEPVVMPNSLWAGTEWSYNKPDDAEVAVFAERLRRHKIGTVYVWVSYMREDFIWSGKRADRNPLTGEVTNTINPDTNAPYRNELAEMEPNIIRFVEQYRVAYPEGELYGWISFPADIVPLDNPTLHTRVAELAALLVTTYGFDGVHLDVEPVLSGDEGYIDMLREVRRTLGTVEESLGLEAPIPLSVAVPPDWRPSDPTIPFGTGFTGVFEWEHDYKQQVALLTDEMVVMAYHSGLTRTDNYSMWVAYQTRAYAEAVAELDIPTRIMIGLPTYSAEPPAHDPLIENIPTAVAGVESGLLQLGEAANVVGGLTIYAEWTTDDEEWAAFYQAVHD